jgi:hypothetical protein
MHNSQLTHLDSDALPPCTQQADDAVVDLLHPQAMTARFSSYKEFHCAMGHSMIENPLRLYPNGDLVSQRPANF